MNPTLTVVATLATALNGLLAGQNVDRLVVQMPAWRRVGVRAWAAYSRRADMGNGFILYPSLAIGGTVLNVISAAMQLSAGGANGKFLAMAVASLLSLAGLLATTRAALYMLSLRRVDDETGLAQAFVGFDRWGTVRAALQILAFVAMLVALALV